MFYDVTETKVELHQEGWLSVWLAPTEGGFQVDQDLFLSQLVPRYRRRLRH
jgi:hypothetical protein